MHDIKNKCTNYILALIAQLISRLNRKAKYLLEKDLQDKFHAQNIDEYCENLKNNSCDMYFNPATAKIEAK